MIATTYKSNAIIYLINCKAKKYVHVRWKKCKNQLHEVTENEWMKRTEEDKKKEISQKK